MCLELSGWGSVGATQLLLLADFHVYSSPPPPTKKTGTQQRASGTRARAVGSSGDEPTTAAAAAAAARGMPPGRTGCTWGTCRSTSRRRTSRRFSGARLVRKEGKVWGRDVDVWVGGWGMVVARTNDFPNQSHRTQFLLSPCPHCTALHCTALSCTAHTTGRVRPEQDRAAENQGRHRLRRLRLPGGKFCRRHSHCRRRPLSRHAWIIIQNSPPTCHDRTERRGKMGTHVLPLSLCPVYSSTQFLTPRFSLSPPWQWQQSAEAAAALDGTLIEKAGRTRYLRANLMDA